MALPHSVRRGLQNCVFVVRLPCKSELQHKPLDLLKELMRALDLQMPVQVKCFGLTFAMRLHDGFPAQICFMYVVCGASCMKS